MRIGFFAVIGVLLFASAIILPDWIRMFLAAIRQYHQYTQNESVLDQLVSHDVPIPDQQDAGTDDLLLIGQRIESLREGRPLRRLRRLRF